MPLPFVSLIGIVVLLGICYALSHNRKAISWRLVGVGLLFVWQHAVAPTRPEFAFFKLNGIIGFAVFGTILAGI